MGIKPKDRVALELVDGGIKISPSSPGIVAGYGAVEPQAKPEDFRVMRREFESDRQCAEPRPDERRKAVEDLLSMEVSGIIYLTQQVSYAILSAWTLNYP